MKAGAEPVRQFLVAAIGSIIVIVCLFIQQDIALAQSPPDLSDSRKNASSPQVQVGEVLTYTIVISNAGEISATNTTMLDPIADDTTYVANSVSGGANYNATENRIEWTGTVSATESVTMTYQVSIDDTLPTTTTDIVNTATISQATLSDVVTVSRTVQIARPADLSRSTKTVEPAIAMPGGTLRYTLVLSNSSNYEAPTVSITDPVPPYTTFQAGSITGGATYSPTENLIFWNGSLDALEERTFTYKVVVSPTLEAYTPIINTVTISRAYQTTPVVTTTTIWSDCGPASNATYLSDSSRSGRREERGQPFHPWVQLLPKWTYPTGRNIESTAIISPDGQIVVGSHDGHVYVLNPNVIPPPDPHTPPPLAWSFELIDETAPFDVQPVYSSPALANDGTVYVAGKNNLYAIKPDGSELRWQFLTGGHIYSSPLISEDDGTIYVGSSDGYLYAINPDGTLQWKYNTGSLETIGYSSPAQADDGTIYIGSTSFLHALNPDGTLQWKQSTRGGLPGVWDSSDSTPTIGPDGTVYIGSTWSDTQGWIFGFTPDGLLRKGEDGVSTFPRYVGGVIASSPTLNNDGSQLFVAAGKNLLRVTADGSNVSALFSAGDQVTSSPMVDAEDKIYLASEDGNVYVITSDGFQIGSYTSGTSSISHAPPTIANDDTGTIYVGTSDGRLLALVEDNQPTGISLSPNHTDDYNPDTGQPASGDTVGYLSTVAPVIDSTYTYTFTEPHGNATDRFDIVDNRVIVKEANRLDLESNPACPRTYQITIISTGSGGLWVKETLTIRVDPVNEEPPTDIALSHTTVEENEDNDTTIGNFSPLGDPDACDTNYSYSKVSDTCGGCVRVQGNQLRVDNSSKLDYETLQSFDVEVEITNPPFIYPETPRKTFTIQITDVNEPPVASEDHYYTNEDTPITIEESKGVLVNDSDPEGQPLTAHMSDPPDSGTLTSFNPDGSFTYAPEENHNGVVEFRYRANDKVNNSPEARVYIHITPVNDPPELDPITPLTLDEGATATIASANLQVNDVDNTPDQLTYTIGDMPDHSTLLRDGSPLTGNTFTQDDINNDRISYEHNGSETAADSFTFTVSDGTGGSIGNTTFTITIAPVNDPPTLVMNCPPTVLEGLTVTIDDSILSVTDPDTDDLPENIIYTLDVAPLNGDLTGSGAPLAKDGTFNQDNVNASQIRYEHHGDENTSDSFTFSVTDGDDHSIASETCTIVVTPNNDPPVLGPHGPISVREGETVTIGTGSLDVTDPDTPSDEIVYRLKAEPGEGTLAIDGATLQDGEQFTKANVEANQLTYTHNGDHPTSDDRFTVNVSDGAGGTIGNTDIDVVIIPDNDPPEFLASPTDQTIEEDTETALLDFTIGDEETDAGNLDVWAESSNTALVPEDDQHLILGGSGANRTIIVRPSANMYSAATIRLWVSDGSNDEPVEFELTVSPIADQPVVTNATTSEETMTTSGLQITPNPLDGGVVNHFRITNILGGTLYKNDGSTVISEGACITAAEGNSELRFLPAQDRNDPGSFTVQSAMGSCPAGASGPTANATITIIPVNDDPILIRKNPLHLDEGETKRIADTLLQVDDVDNTPQELRFTLETAPQHGDLLRNCDPGEPIAAGGTFSQYEVNNDLICYKHTALEKTADHFEFSVSDGAGGSIDTQMFNINMEPVNDTPTIVTNRSLTVDEGKTGTIVRTMLETTDQETTDPASIIYVVGDIPQNGTLKRDGALWEAGDTFSQKDINDGLMSYAHDGTETTEDGFTFTVSDGEGGAVDSEFNIVIDLTNDTPTVSPVPDQAIDEDTETSSLVFTIDDEETDVNALTLTPYSSDATLVPESNIVIGGSGARRTVTVRPLGNAYGGPATITICVSDGEKEGCREFDVTVDPVADLPDVTNASTDEDTQTTSGLVLSRNDADGSEVTHFLISSIENGFLFQHDGTTGISDGECIPYAEGNQGLRFTPDNDSTETGSFEVRAALNCAGDGASSLLQATITVQSKNDPPQVSVNPITVKEGETDVPILNTALQATDVDHLPDQLQYILLDMPEGTLKRAGSPLTKGAPFTQKDIDDSLITYSHDGSEADSDTVTFKVVDGDGSETAPTTFVINVININDAPRLAVLSLNPPEGGTVCLNKIGFRAEDDDNTPDELTFTLVAPPTSGELKNEGFSINPGETFSWSNVAAGDEVCYTHDGSENHTDSFMVYVSDPVGDTSEPVEVPITVSEESDPPVLVENNPLSLDEGERPAPVIGQSLLRAEDPDDLPGDITYRVLSAPENGVLRYNGGELPNNQFTQADINAGIITYEHNGTSTESDQFTFTVRDASNVEFDAGSATFFISITPINDLPTLSGVAPAQSTTEDTPLVFSVMVDDEESLATDITLSGFSSNTTVVPNENITFEGSGSRRTVRVTPAPNKTTQPDNPVTITLCPDDGTDENCDESKHSFKLTIAPTPDRPSVRNTTTDEDTMTTSGLIISRNDVDGNEVTHFKIQDIQGGTLYYHDGKTVINDGNFIAVADGEAGLRFMPEKDRNAPATFKVYASLSNEESGVGGTSATATITINPVNDPPQATDDNPDTYTVNEGETLTIEEEDGVRINDTDIEGDTLTVSIIPSTPPAYATMFNLHADGSFVYQHNGGEATEDFFVYRVCDDGDPIQCDTATVYITIVPVNDPPDAETDNVTMDEGGSVVIDVLENDNDPEGDTLTITLEDEPADAKEFTYNGNGTFSYTHNGDEVDHDSFTYLLYDDGTPNECSKGTVFITITPINDKPVAGDNSYTVKEGETLSIGPPGLRNNDSDAENHTLTVSESLALKPAYGDLTLHATGAFSYTHNGSEQPHIEQFGYQVCDNGSPMECSTATVTITIEPVNDAPIAYNDSFDIYATSPEVQAPGVIGNDTDADGPFPLVASTTLIRTPNYADTFTLSEDGAFTYIHNGSKHYEDSFVYKVCDNGSPNECDTAEVSIAYRDQPGVIIDEGQDNTTVTEGGACDTYNIKLNTPPSANVVVILTPDAEVTVLPQTLDFSTTDWNIWQTVEVCAHNDKESEGTHEGKITHTFSSGDSDYGGLPNKELSVSIIDDDTPGVEVSQSGGSTIVVEKGPADTYTIQLTTEPKEKVSITISPAEGQTLVSPATLSFTPDNWNQPQTINVSAFDDSDKEGNHNGRIVHTLTTRGSDYDGVSVPDVAVAIVDDDSAGVSVAESGGQTSVAEGNGVDTLGIALTSRPTARVTVTVSVDESQLLAEAGTLVYTPENWNVPQVIRVWAGDDDIHEGKHYSMVSFDIRSDDGNYHKLPVHDIRVSIADNDLPGVSIVESGGSTNLLEGSINSDSYQVKLTTAPTATVVITINTDRQLTVEPASLSFTPDTWNIAQVVTVSANDNGKKDGNRHSTITHLVSSSDTTYDTIPVNDVIASITDDDIPGIDIVESGDGTAVTEGKDVGDTYTIALNSKPSAGEVLVHIETGSQTSVISPTIHFDASNWSIPQTVKVYAVNDDWDEGSLHYGKITHRTSSSSPEYDELDDIGSIIVAITDNESAGVNRETPLGETVSEDGDTAIIQVSLTSRPASAVELHLETSDQITIDQTDQHVLRFGTNENDWSKARTLTIRAIDDEDVEGNHHGIIRWSIKSDDESYRDLSLSDMAIDIVDNDGAGVRIIETEGTEVDESGLTDSYQVVLAKEPTHPVVVTIVADNQVNIDETELTFNADTWDIPQTVTVEAVDDEFVEGYHNSTINHSVESNDPKYHRIETRDVQVRITDDDYPGVIITPTDGSTDIVEGGKCDTYTAFLTKEPVADVTVYLHEDSQTTVDVDQQSLGFTPLTWSEVQTVTVCAFDDILDEGGEHAGTVTHSAESTDENYNDIGIKSVVATITDNDSYGIEIQTDEGEQWANPGTSATAVFSVTNRGNAADTIALSSQSQWDVTMDPESRRIVGLPSGETVLVTVTVTIPADAKGGAQNTVVVEATSETDPRASDTASIRTTANTLYGAVLSPPQSERTGAPGQEVEHTFTITNISNISELFDIEVGGGQWEYTTSPVEQTRQLVPGADTAVSVRVAVPSDAISGVSETATITITSQQDPSAIVTATLTTVAGERYGILLEQHPGYTRVPTTGLAQVISHTLHVRNGNNHEATVSLTTDDEWNTRLIPEHTGPIPAGGYVTVTLGLEVPSDIAETSCVKDSVSHDTRIIATSPAFASVPLATDELTVTSTITFSRGVSMTQHWEKIVPPGTDVEYTIRVTNTGQVSETFHFDRVEQIWSTSIEQETLSLPSGTSGLLRVRVRVPSDATGSDTVRIVGTSSCDSTTSAETTLTTIINDYDIEIQPDEREQSGNPGTSATAVFSVTNRGNAADTIRLSVPNESSEWPVQIIPDTIPDLQPGETAPVHVIVTIPADADGGDEYIALVAATSETNPKAADTASLRTTAKTLYGAVLNPPQSERTGAPGQEVEHTFTITNISNISELFDIAVEEGPWKYTVSPAGQTNQLVSGASATVDVQVTVPPDAISGMSDTATITITPRHDVSAVVTATLTTVTGERYGISIEPQPGFTRVPATGLAHTISYTMYVWNRGNHETTASIVAYDDWIARVYPPETGPILPGEYVSVTLELEIPPDIAETTCATKHITHTTTVKAISPASSEEPRATDRVEMISSITFSRDVFMTPRQDTKTVAPGEEAIYTLWLTNTGQVEETYFLSTLEHGWPTRIAPQEITLAPGESDSFRVIVTPNVPGTDVATIHVMSSCDPATDDDAILTTTARDTIDVAISPEQEKRRVDLNAAMTYYLEIENTGTIGEQYALDYSSTGDWDFAVAPSDLPYLQAGETFPLSATITTPPQISGKPQNTLVITVTSLRDPDVAATATLTTHAVLPLGFVNAKVTAVEDTGDDDQDKKEVEIELLRTDPDDLSEKNVCIETTSGTASAGVDYVPLRREIVISEDITRTKVFVDLLKDDEPELDETIILRLSPSPCGVEEGSAPAQAVTIERNVLRHTNTVSPTLALPPRATPTREGDIVPIAPLNPVPQQQAGVASADSPAENFIYEIELIIEDNDRPPEGLFTIRPPEPVEEGETASVIIERVGGNSPDATVRLSTIDMTAVASGDYEKINQRLVEFTGGNTIQNVSIETVEDGVAEGDERIMLMLSDPTNNVALDPQPTAELVIRDNDPHPAGVVQFTQPVYRGEEGSYINNTVPITIEILGDITRDVTVFFETQPDGARPVSDFRALAEDDCSHTFKPGESKTHIIHIPIFDDTDTEGDETFFVNLTRANNGAIIGSQGTAVVVIGDDDFDNNELVVQFEQLEYVGVESTDDGSGPLEEHIVYVPVTVELYGVASDDVCVFLNMYDGTATRGGDCEGSCGADYAFERVGDCFDPGTHKMTANVPILPDSIIEGDETANIYLTLDPNGSGMIFNDVILGNRNNATFRIIDDEDDPNGIFQVGKTEVQIGEKSHTKNPSHYVRIPVDRVSGTNRKVTVHWETFPFSSSGARPGEDYTHMNGELDFDQGEAREYIKIPILDDDLQEGDEVFGVRLLDFTKDPAPATIGSQSTTLVTILDDETPEGGTFHLSQPIYGTSESITETVTVDINVFRTGSTVGKAKITYTTVDLDRETTATPDLDYSPRSGELWFEDGDEKQSITLEIYPDELTEGTEQVVIELLEVSENTHDAVLGTQSRAILSISDGNFVPAGVFVFGATNFSVSDTSDTGYMSVFRTGGSIGAVDLTYCYDAEGSNGGAILGEDFALVNPRPNNEACGTLRFEEGETQKDIPIDILEDNPTEPEGDEWLDIELVEVSGEAQIGDSQKRASLTILESANWPAGILRFEKSENRVEEPPDEDNNRYPSYQANESDPMSPTNDLEIPVVRQSGTDGDVEILYTIFDGSTNTTTDQGIPTDDDDGSMGISRYGWDYEEFAVNNISKLQSGKLRFRDGEDTPVEPLFVKVKGDNLSEGLENLFIVLHDPTNQAALGTNNFTIVEIIDNEPLEVMTGWRARSVYEDEGTIEIPVVLSGISEHTITVECAFIDGTAKKGINYEGDCNQITFAPGEMRQIVSVDIMTDTVYNEDGVSFSLELSNPIEMNGKYGVRLGDPSEATVTILDRPIEGTVELIPPEGPIYLKDEVIVTAMLKNGGSDPTQYTVDFTTDASAGSLARIDDRFNDQGTATTALTATETGTFVVTATLKKDGLTGWQTADQTEITIYPFTVYMPVLIVQPDQGMLYLDAAEVKTQPEDQPEGSSPKEYGEYIITVSKMVTPTGVSNVLRHLLKRTSFVLQTDTGVFENNEQAIDKKTDENGKFTVKLWRRGTCGKAQLTVIEATELTGSDEPVTPKKDARKATTEIAIPCEEGAYTIMPPAHPPDVVVGEQTNIRTVVKDTGGNTVYGEEVRYVVDGEAIAIGETDRDGVVDMPYTCPTTAGEVEIEVETSNGSDIVTIPCVAGLPASLEFLWSTELEPEELLERESRVGETIGRNIVVVVRDRHGNPVEKQEVVLTLQLKSTARVYPPEKVSIDNFGNYQPVKLGRVQTQSDTHGNIYAYFGDPVLTSGFLAIGEASLVATLSEAREGGPVPVSHPLVFKPLACNDVEPNNRMDEAMRGDNDAIPNVACTGDLNNEPVGEDDYNRFIQAQGTGICLYLDNRNKPDDTVYKMWVGAAYPDRKIAGPSSKLDNGDEMVCVDQLPALNALSPDIRGYYFIRIKLEEGLPVPNKPYTFVFLSNVS